MDKIMSELEPKAFKQLKALHEFTDGNRTGQVFLTEGKNRYMVLLYQADLDYNEAHYFASEEDAEICAEDWVLIK
jgi:hypothetical protein